MLQELEKELMEVEELLEIEQRSSKEQLRKHSMLVQVLIGSRNCSLPGPEIRKQDLKESISKKDLVTRILQVA